MYLSGSPNILNRKRPSGGDLLADDPSGALSHRNPSTNTTPQWTIIRTTNTNNVTKCCLIF